MTEDNTLELVICALERAQVGAAARWLALCAWRRSEGGEARLSRADAEAIGLPRRRYETALGELDALAGVDLGGLSITIDREQRHATRIIFGLDLGTFCTKTGDPILAQNVPRTGEGLVQNVPRSDASELGTKRAKTGRAGGVLGTKRAKNGSPVLVQNVPRNDVFDPILAQNVPSSSHAGARVPPPPPLDPKEAAAAVTHASVREALALLDAADSAPNAVDAAAPRPHTEMAQHLASLFAAYRYSVRAVQIAGLLTALGAQGAAPDETIQYVSERLLKYSGRTPSEPLDRVMAYLVDDFGAWRARQARTQRQIASMAPPEAWQAPTQETKPEAPEDRALFDDEVKPYV